MEWFRMYHFDAHLVISSIIEIAAYLLEYD